MDRIIGQIWMMEQPRVSWTHSLYLAALTFLQITCILCSRNTTHCSSPPCKEDFPCLSSKACERLSDPCLSNPCPQNATCQVTLDTETYECRCPAGFKGRHCEIPMKRCFRNLCRHGGQCYVSDRGSTCFCAVGYKGTFCETPEDECLWNPCQNGAVCRERGNGQACYCVPGFQGALCDIEVNECISQPCQHGGTCLNQIGSYSCVCPPKYTGVRCEQDINECESNPCQNGGTCEDLLGSYICHCPTYKDLEGRYYGGPDCMEVLNGCEEHICQNGGSCLPHLMDNKHDHTCLCVPGFTGPYCETQTTLSFNGRTILPLALKPQRGEPFNVALTFRTVQSSAAILHLGDQAAAMRLYLQDGFLFLSLHCSGQLRTLLYLPHNVSDDLWHTAEINFRDNIHFKLLDPSCGITCVNQSHRGEASNIEFQEMFFGGEPSAQRKQGTNFTDIVQIQMQFVGCIRDIKVGSIIITEEDGKLANIEVGCKRRDHCESHPCGNQGKCINLWLSYYCDCRRPYRGNNCSTEYEEAGFGYGNVSSYAVFQTRSQPHDDMTISAFVITKHDTGLLFSMGNSTHYNIIVSLESGKLTVKTRNGIMSKGEQSISDGQVHLVTLKLTQKRLDLFTSSLPLDFISMDFKREQYTSVLYVGGLGDSLETMKEGGYFKGCIQDLRIDGRAFEFFTSFDSKNSGNTTLINVTRGCLNDIICKNEGTYDGTYRNDCLCSPSTTGKACEDLMMCQLTQCPSGSVCQAVPGGYECISNALFSGNGQAITFTSNGKIIRDLTNLTIGFRTMDSESVVLHAQREPEILRVNIQNKLLHFHLQSGNDLNAVTLLSMESVSDNQWHTVTLSMTSPGSQSSTWQMEIDGKTEKTISSLATGNLNFLREGTDIYLGADSDGMYRNFTGCLGTVLIEGIHLPYFADTDYLMVKPQVEQFLKTSPEIVDIRCLESDPCASNPCLFGGSCRDVFTLPVCTCPKGRSGDVCENKTAECLPNPCAHGHCTIKDDGYKCECETGYTGTNCDFILCHGHLCAKGATCIVRADGYFCLCPANVTGKHCRFNIMPSKFCGNEKKNITCYNYSNCTAVQGVLGCSCQPGYVGESCLISCLPECLPLWPLPSWHCFLLCVQVFVSSLQLLG
ncbi:protein crumbs homolog 1 isoform X2 [Rhinoderma darwinii]|uniref:protein crumbs homolog 1 isoform X2 n=1 Tax=Rhinoderma darwinii TaxID=43563 RepID=UPI003F66E9FC